MIGATNDHRIVTLGQLLVRNYLNYMGLNSTGSMPS